MWAQSALTLFILLGHLDFCQLQTPPHVGCQTESGQGVKCVTRSLRASDCFTLWCHMPYGAFLWFLQINNCILLNLLGNLKGSLFYINGWVYLKVLSILTKQLYRYLLYLRKIAAPI